MLNTLTINDKTLNYNDTLKLAKKIDPQNFMDITHDYLLDGGNLKSLKFNYKTSAVIDFTKLNGTSNTCTICNEIKPVACFKIVENLGSKYLGNQCKDCLYDRSKERYKIDPEFRSAVYYYNKKWKSKNLEKVKQYQKEYWKEWVVKNAEYRKISRQLYREENIEKIRERERINSKRYREKKKLEKLNKLHNHETTH